MSKAKTAINLLLHDRTKFLSAALRLFPFLFSDKKYLSIQYNLRIGRKLSWENPQTFTEKLQWLKINNRNPLFSTMVDKYEVKDYVANIIGREFIIPTLGVWNSVEEIDWENLPDRFVLKTTHGGGGAGVIIIKDKQKAERSKIERLLRKSLSQNIYRYNREWPYKNVYPRIIAEQFLDSEGSSELNDYKFFCFNGKVKFFKIDIGRFKEHHANYFSPEGELLPFGEKACPPDFNVKLEIPTNITEMIKLAEQLSSSVDFLRVDFYNVNGRVYFGELTFFPAGGFGSFVPEEWDKKLGDLLRLPN